MTWKATRIALVGAMAVALALLIAPGSGRAEQGANRVALVVVSGEGQVEKRCVSFNEQAITGAEALGLSGLPLKVQVFPGLGVAVCGIGGQGCDYPKEDCFCKSYGTPALFWNYLHLKEGRWVGSPVGPASYRVKDGDVDGWAWSSEATAQKLLPAGISFNDVCPVGLPAQAATAATAETATAPAAGSVPGDSALSPVAERALPVGETQAAATSAWVGRVLVFGLIAAALTGGLVYLLARRTRRG